MTFPIQVLISAVLAGLIMHCAYTGNKKAILITGGWSIIWVLLLIIMYM
jgi:hypothetical protein